MTISLCDVMRNREKDPLKMRKHILKMLRKEPRIIDDISKGLKIHRVTAAKYMFALEMAGIIRHRQIGKAKLFFLVNKHG